MAIDPRLLKLGFTSVGRPAGDKRRLFITSEGPTAAGKSRFLTTMRGPIVVIDFDHGLEGVCEIDIAGNEIARQVIEIPDLDNFAKTASETERDLAKREYARFKKLVHDTLSCGAAGTLAIDTGTAAYALAQIARFGQIAQVGEVPAAMWTSMQSEFEQVFLEYEKFGCNLYVTHRQGTKFKGAPGETEMKGYKQMQYLSQIHLGFEKRLQKDEKSNVVRVNGVQQFELYRKVVKCRQRLGLEGAEFPVVFLDDEKTTSVGGDFLELAMAVFPNTTEKDWL